jgi:hypothetical protein
MHVKLVRTFVPDAIASDEVASGVREELARRGALEGGDGWPRIEVEVLRADETSEGVAVLANRPVARATAVTLVARAWVVASPDSSAQRNTGDLSADDTFAVDTNVATGARDPRASLFHRADALRAAARRLGIEIARRIASP